MSLVVDTAVMVGEHVLGGLRHLDNAPSAQRNSMSSRSGRTYPQRHWSRMSPSKVAMPLRPNT